MDAREELENMRRLAALEEKMGGGASFGDRASESLFAGAQKAGAGIMTLSATNDFNGPIHVTGGEIDVTNVANQLHGVTALQLDAGTTLKITNGGTVPCGFKF